MQKLHSIQVLRGVAACMVVVLHAYGIRYASNGNLIQLGAAGVDIFFVISGFIMATIAEGKTAGQFLTDRLWRIYPVWLIAMVPWLWIYPPADWQGIVASFTLWPSYPAFTFPALLVGWTLSFEMLFYLSMALAIRTRAYVPLSLFLLGLGLGLLTRHPLFDFIGNPMIFEFLFGVCIARAPVNRKVAFPLLAIGIAGFIFSPPDLFGGEVATHAASAWLRVLCWGIPAALIVYAVRSLEDFRWPSLAVELGNASYSIYLFHMLAIKRLHVNWVAEGCLAVALGLVAHTLLEKPIMALRRAKVSKRSKSDRLKSTIAQL